MSDMPSATQTVVVASPARVLWKEYVPLIALLITVVTVLVGGGKTLGKVEDNTRRIVVLEARADRRDDQMSDLRERIGAIDAKLDLLVKRTAPDHR